MGDIFVPLQSSIHSAMALILVKVFATRVNVSTARHNKSILVPNVAELPVTQYPAFIYVFI